MRGLNANQRSEMSLRLQAAILEWFLPGDNEYFTDLSICSSFVNICSVTIPYILLRWM